MFGQILLLFSVVSSLMGATVPDEKRMKREQETYGDDSAQYSFEWVVIDEDYGNNFGHQEERDGDDTKGAYYVLLPDGRTQKVDYFVSGDSGFVADVTYDGDSEYDESSNLESLKREVRQHKAADILSEQQVQLENNLDNRQQQLESVVANRQAVFDEQQQQLEDLKKQLAEQIELSGGTQGAELLQGHQNQQEQQLQNIIEQQNQQRELLEIQQQQQQERTQKGQQLLHDRQLRQQEQQQQYQLLLQQQQQLLQHRQLLQRHNQHQLQNLHPQVQQLILQRLRQERQLQILNKIRQQQLVQQRAQRHGVFGKSGVFGQGGVFGQVGHNVPGQQL